MTDTDSGPHRDADASAGRHEPHGGRVEPIPNFFIVGAPKCATTSMDIYLSRHPDIYMSPSKEPHYFAKDLYRGEVACPEDRYFGFFEGVRDEPVVGESSVFYMLSETAAEAIHAFQPAAKILIMLRNPIEVIASHHSQILYEAFETERSLERALEMEERRARDFAGRALDFRQKVLLYREVVDFPTQIERFRRYFPDDQIHVVLHDDIRADLPAVYHGILDFLGVDPDFRPEFRVENANKVARSAALTNFLRYTPDWVTRASRVLLPKREWRVAVRKRLKRANTSFQPRPPMPDALRDSLSAELEPTVRRLETLLGRDLSHWIGRRDDSQA